MRMPIQDEWCATFEATLLSAGGRRAPFDSANLAQRVGLAYTDTYVYTYIRQIRNIYTPYSESDIRIYSVYIYLVQFLKLVLILIQTRQRPITNSADTVLTVDYRPTDSNDSLQNLIMGPAPVPTDRVGRLIMIPVTYTASRI
jgi:hypothetical protein